MVSGILASADHPQCGCGYVICNHDGIVIVIEIFLPYGMV
jgi:hypothetical protein